MAELYYEGSITVDRELLKTADKLPYEKSSDCEPEYMGKTGALFCD